MTDLTPAHRLGMLCDLWGEICLFHPAIADAKVPVDLNRIFADSLAALETTTSASRCVGILNDVLLAPLGDPLSFARVLPGTASDAHHSVSAIVCRQLPGSPTAHYISLGPPAFARRTFLSDLRRALESAANAALLLVDLRWGCAVECKVPTTFLGFWASEQCRTPVHVTRVHRGWHELTSEYVYSHRWEAPRHKPFGRLARPTDLPTLFLVDNASVLHFSDALSVLRGTANVRVVWQRTGPFSVPSRRCLRYPSGIRVHLNLTFPRFAPDLVVESEIPDTALAQLQTPAATGARSAASLAGRPVVMPERHTSATGPAPSRSERLMALAKLTVVLKHFYPHFALAGLRADHVLRRWLPAMEAAASWKDYCLVLERLVASLNDSHAAVAHPALDKEMTARIPAELSMSDGRLVVRRASSSVPLSPGDEVIGIDGRPVPDIMDAWRRRISASSEQAFLRDLCRRACLGPKDSEAEVTYRREGVVRHVTVRREAMQPPRTGRAAAAAALTLPGCGHAVLMTEDRLACLMPFEIPSVRLLDVALDMVRDSSGLVLDLRGYPRVHFQHAFVRRLCDGPVESPRYEIPIAGGPVATRRRWQIIRYTVRPEDVEPRPRVYDKPVVALISAETQSSAEDLCMYLRIAGRATFVGQPTAGCHGNAAFVFLPGGARVSFTGMRVTWPDGRPFQGIGVLPDVRVDPARDGVVAEGDEILRQGLDVLRRLTAMS